MPLHPVSHRLCLDPSPCSPGNRAAWSLGHCGAHRPVLFHPSGVTALHGLKPNVLKTIIPYTCPGVSAGAQLGVCHSVLAGSRRAACISAPLGSVLHHEPDATTPSPPTPRAWPAFSTELNPHGLFSPEGQWHLRSVGADVSLL